VSLLVQVTGSALIVAAFAASQAGRIGRSSRLCLAASVIGSLALAASALLGSQWGFLALEGVWLAVSLVSLGKTFCGSGRLECDGSGNSPTVSTRAGADPATAKG
jgi:hypothetical protein